MKTPQQIYNEYKIQTGLQRHQLRVAAVGKLVCDNFKKPIATHDVIVACLFHDMGNIIKMDLGTFPAFLEPEGLEYWKEVKSEFVRKYGDNAHKANVAIAKELNLPPSVITLVDSVSFSNIERIVREGSFEQKVCEYADCRVGPHGVLSLEERLSEARARYLKAKSEKEYYTEEGFQSLAQNARTLESHVFAACSITPPDVSDASITPFVDELRNYTVD